jgi:tetratricopeptide (TPR) repeat protein
MIHPRISILAGSLALCALRLAGQADLPAPPTPPQEPIPVTPAPTVPFPPEPPLPPEPLLPPDFDQSIAAISANASRIAADAVANLRTGFFQRDRINESKDDRLYENGQRALDRNQWDEALTDFTQVANHGSPRADGALYWKAYALNKLGRRDEAITAISDLRKSYAKSRWLDDANALEIEVKQASGQSVSPDAQPDEELKLLALNALVRSDPQRAIPILENLLKGSQPPRLKERALFVLIQTNSTEGEQLLVQMARGNVNPDLQLKAIQYLGMASNQQNSGQSLAEIYSATSDVEVKHAVINALGVQERNIKILVDLAKKERDLEMKREIVRRLSNSHSKEALDYMMELLK